MELRLVDASATEALGAALARGYRAVTDSMASVGSLVVYLEGELGAGKTTCVRSLLRTLGVSGLIRSPTYTLVELYELGTLSCVHVDLYRLHGPAEVDELGLRDYQASGCLLLVEWPEKGGAALPPADLVVSLRYDGDSRTCRLVALSTLGRELLSNLGNDHSLAVYVSNLT